MLTERKTAGWMTALDERLLEHLDDTDGSLTAWQAAYDLGPVTWGRVTERCRVLAEAGFVVVLQRENLGDRYDITGWGQRYLEGEIDADHRRPVPAQKPPGKMRPGWYAGFG